MAIETWLEYMTRRGWTTKVIQRYGVGGSRYDERPCLKYHTVNTEGEKAHRVKFVDDLKKDENGKALSKVKWAGSTVQAAFRYYSPGGLKAAIKNASGTLYWLSGEPDCWTLFEACGIDFSTCCFGEGSVPKESAIYLSLLGVERVVMYPDLDSAGMKAAWKLHNELKDSGIELIVRRIPGEMESKRDLNQLWQDMSFNSTAFTEALKKSVVLTETDLELYSQEEKPATSQPKQTSLDIDFGDMFGKWIDECVQALGQCDVREGRIERWHCPTGRHASGDRNPSLRVGDGDTCKMPICTCGLHQLKPIEAWNEIARAKGVPTWDDYKARKLADLGVVKTAKANPPQAPHTNGSTPKAETVADTEPLWVDSHTVYSQILDTLEGYNIPDIEIVDFPLECLHEFGGFAEIMFPGKLVYLSGISGGGKTSIAETMGEKLLRQGYDFVWYGPEWTPYEMGLRSLQRAQGADMMTMAKNYQYQVQAKRGIDESKRKGRLLSDSELVNSNREILNMANWPGRSYFMTAQANKLPLADMLNTVRYIVNLKRSEGRKVIGFFFDYLQRANKAGRQHAFWSEEVIGEIKSLCEELQLIGFVMIQPKKGDSEKARDDTALSEASGQGISDQQCNLYLAVTPKFENEIKTSYSVLRVVKNSMGKTGEITVQNDWQRLLLIDKRIRLAGVL